MTSLLENLGSTNYLNVISAQLKTLAVLDDVMLNSLITTKIFNIFYTYYFISSQYNTIQYKTANTIACSLIASKLDYCNSLLAGTTAQNISRLQRMQNNAARVVCQATRCDSVRPLLQKLHWLPIEQRIQYKVSMLTFKALTMGAPMYLRDLLIIHEPSRVLRSAGSNRL